MTEAQEPAADETVGVAIDRLRQAATLLDDIDTVTLADAAGRFDALHSELQAALSDLDRA